MTDREWLNIVAQLTANWPHALPPEVSLLKWRQDLDDLPARQVMAAVESLYRDGREFCPNGAQIRGAVIDANLDLPDWGEVWHLIDQAIGRYGYARFHEAIGWLGDHHELLPVFVNQVSWRELCLSEDPAGVREAQCRRVWTDLANRAQRERKLAGIPSAGLRTLERINGPRRIGGVLGWLTEGEK